MEATTTISVESLDREITRRIAPLRNALAKELYDRGFGEMHAQRTAAALVRHMAGTIEAASEDDDEDGSGRNIDLEVRGSGPLPEHAAKKLAGQLVNQIDDLILDAAFLALEAFAPLDAEDEAVAGQPRSPADGSFLPPGHAQAAP